MKFIHISDLHLGKRVNEFSMLDDQRYILEQVVKEAENADAVLIAGDIYDKSIPPAEAVELFDLFITELAKMNVKIFAVSGNHDSAKRIAFGSDIMHKGGVYFSHIYNGELEKHEFEDKYGKVNIYMLPFIKPAVIKNFFEDGIITDDYNSALKAVLDRADIDFSERNIIIAHQFVTGAQRSESEEVSVGGVDSISADLFENFDYTALGHIHKPQNMGRNIRYCGTPLKYSFSEANNKNSMTVVELNEKGNVEISFIPFSPLHDMREIKGTYDFLTERKNYENTAVEDYLHITLTDEEEVIDAIGKLRSIYPNIMKIDYENIRTSENKDFLNNKTDLNKNPLDLFKEFYELQNNSPMTEEQTEEIRCLWEMAEEENI